MRNYPRQPSQNKAQLKARIDLLTAQYSGPIHYSEHTLRKREQRANIADNLRVAKQKRSLTLPTKLVANARLLKLLNA